MEIDPKNSRLTFSHNWFRMQQPRSTLGSEVGPSRPVTSYFALKSQSDERAAASLSPDTISPNATVKPNVQRLRVNPFGSTLKASGPSPESRNVTEPVAPRQVTTNGRATSNTYSTPRIKTPGMTPRAQSPVSRSQALPESAATVALSTQWHNITDEEMENTITTINQVMPDPESHQQTYRSTLRLLSSQLENLCKKNEAIRRRKVASMMEIIPPSEIATLRAVMDILSQDNFEEELIEGPQLVVSDSLTEAIAEALTPLGMPSPVNPSDTVSRHEDMNSTISSARGTDRDHTDAASIRSRSSRRSRDPKNRPGSIIEEWMGGWWKDKERDKSASSLHEDDSDGDRSPSPRVGEDTEVEQPKKKRSGGLRMFGVPSSWIGSAPATSNIPEPPERKREPKRKLSVAISVTAVSMNSPVTPHFQPNPSSVPQPTIAPQISILPSTSPTSPKVPKAPVETIPPLPSGPHPSHIKAISYATRVMRSDPNSILVDGGINVSHLVADLAYALVCNLKANKDFSLREAGRADPKASVPQTPATANAPDVPTPALAVAQMEPTESRAAIISNLSRTLNNAIPTGSSRRTASLAITGPLLFGFKSRAASGSEQSAKPGPSSSTVAVPQTGPQLGLVNPTAPKTGTVELESIIPAEARPPTLYLSRTYTSYIADPAFRPSAFPSAPSRFTTKTGGSIRTLETQTDRFGFIYDASVYDVNLLARAREFGNTAPACLTGVKIADREAETEEEDWWPSHESDVPPSKQGQLKVMPEPCTCTDGVFQGIGTEGDKVESKVDIEGSAAVPTDSANEADSAAVDPQASATETSSKSSTKENSNAEESSTPKIPNHVCIATVRVLLIELKEIHDKKQKAQRTDWDSLLRRARKMKDFSLKQNGAPQTVLGQASSGAAIFLGLSKATEDKEPVDEEASWTTGLGLVHVLTNKDEWKEFIKLTRGGIPLVHRSKVWFECSGAIELSEPGVFRDLAMEAKHIDDNVKSGSKRHVALEEIEKDVTRTMPLNIFFGGDGQGVDKLRAVLGAYSL
ncbi:hypothetical protein M408DRAFT_16983 [Serendipita vermifera MAFF 305830]|uniref:Rab-GAP TBC domain-containing protein n=1 Tax=Serendipita vermifera MAFF 305830 TaxID=933852 RepID=A0A0C3B2A1_SERVB|nr:hypothetical protein M408DRAFT_16983 [Serendipita vermifera MAFF 305830]